MEVRSCEVVAAQRVEAERAGRVDVAREEHGPVVAARLALAEQGQQVAVHRPRRRARLLRKVLDVALRRQVLFQEVSAVLLAGEIRKTDGDAAPECVPGALDDVDRAVVPVEHGDDRACRGTPVLGPVVAAGSGALGAEVDRRRRDGEL